MDAVAEFRKEQEENIRAMTQDRNTKRIDRLFLDHVTDYKYGYYFTPKGFAHGFLALEEGSVMNYLLGAQYVKDVDGGIVWNDPELAICWPVEQADNLLIAEKDRLLPSFSTFCSRWGGLPCGVEL